jgi:aryl-alcohol dehydrogenase-like predicted oxidoreductase
LSSTSSSSSSSSPYQTLEGYATPEGTKKYIEYAISQGRPRSHFKSFDSLHLSSIGMGTYLGQLSEEDDQAVENAIYQSVKSGAINVIDTAINYRAMRSEKSIGRALLRLVNDRIISRDQVFVSTKNGYITNDGDYPNIDVMEYIHRMYIQTEVITADDISSGYNVINPNYLAKCIDKSLMNMHTSTIDLVYIHNAFESWYQDVSREQFMEMLVKAFEVMKNIGLKTRFVTMAWQLGPASEFPSVVQNTSRLSRQSRVPRVSEARIMGLDLSSSPTILHTARHFCLGTSQ